MCSASSSEIDYIRSEAEVGQGTRHEALAYAGWTKDENVLVRPDPGGLRHALIELEGVHVSTDPTRQLLVRGRLRIRVGTGSQDRNE